MRQLTDAELNTISLLATIAAEHYEANAKELRKSDPGADDNLKATYTRLAEQFDRQATEAKAIATMFDGMPPVMVGNCQACLAANPDHSSRDCPDRRLLALIEGRA